ncbi:hypothetical protein J1605_006405 [Eschrichtius robustus]|uniref:Uncharacterized protein n=1 Tax=Eschrichtius robustus TaxID=9764 RepID=A0AB34H5K1_ESCRO|nr:hypothetical protein J1605_006405 [Eschrichtius robustus]
MSRSLSHLFHKVEKHPGNPPPSESHARPPQGEASGSRKLRESQQTQRAKRHPDLEDVDGQIDSKQGLGDGRLRAGRQREDHVP